MHAGLLTAGVVFAVFLAAPVPGWCVEKLGAPRDGIARFGGMRAGWLRHEAEADVADLQRRLEVRGLAATLQARGPFVTIEILSLPERDMARVVRVLRGTGVVEIRELEPDGSLASWVLFERAQMREAIVTSVVTGYPKVVLWLWRPGSDYLKGKRAAITVDHEVRGTAALYSLFRDVVVFDVDRGDLVELAEALDGGAMHGGTLLYAEHVPPADLAGFEWAARAAIAAMGGAGMALIASFALRRSRAC
jgi:hypothetical protein